MDLKFNKNKIKDKKLILIELNEINFDLVKKYLKKFNGKFKNFKIISDQILITQSESKYNLLEPWIQWYSIYSGLSAEQHKVFRLGDGVNSNIELIYEKLEKLGYTIGAISPMNAKNNCLYAKYFIPDPWTITKSDGSFLSKLISSFLNQTVNNNANEKLTFKNYLTIIYLLIRFAQFKNYVKYLKLFLTSFGNKWRKAIFLDLILHDIHLSLFTNKKPNFSSIFFNAGAHIQHHYLHNSLATNNRKNPSSYVSKNKDPFYEIIEFYDLILGDYLDKQNCQIILATGLTQKVTEKIEYYYRLRDHERFLRDNLSIKFKSVKPRMSRDFLIIFNNNLERDEAFRLLKYLELNNQRLFHDIEIRNEELFVTMTYNSIIKKNDYILFKGKQIFIFDEVSFVAIKNGEHMSKGYLYSKNNLDSSENLLNNIHVKDIHNLILNYFVK